MPTKRLADIMTWRLVEAQPTETLAVATTRMRHAEIGSLLIVDEGKVIGILTERDVLRALAERMAPETPVAAVMSQPVVTASQELDYRAGHHIMTEHGIRHLLVVDGTGQPVGIVSDSDFKHHLGRDFLASLHSVGKVMSNCLVALPAATPIATALQRMRAQGVSCTVVIEEERPIGIFTERDAVKLFNHLDLERTSLGEVMSTPVATIGIEAGMLEASALMTSRHIRHLVVIDEAGRAAGTLDEHDIVRQLEGALLDHYVRERLRTEHELLKFSRAIEQSPVSIVITDTEGRIEYVNPRFCEITGYSAEEAIGQNPRIIQSGRTPLATYQAMWGALKSGRGWSGEIENRRKNGEFYWEYARLMPITGPGGQITHYLGVKEDITYRKAVEAKLKLAASVFANTHDGIMITDAAGTIIEVNDAFTELTGFSREEAIGATPALLKSGYHDAGFYAALYEALEKEGHWRGEMHNRRKDGRQMVALMSISRVNDEAGRPAHYVSVFSDITPLKEHERHLETLAHYDPLTHLPNRALLGDRLRQALAAAQRSGELLAICYLDLDGFKPVNDTLGHAAGDELLREIARRLEASIRGGDTVARLGGDEFVLLLGKLAGLAELEIALTRILSAIHQPIAIGDQEVSVSGSLGVTLYPLDDSDADTLLRHADQAMYRAKEAGRNRYHLFDIDQDARAKSHRDNLRRIEAALAEHRFELHYQPKVNMKSGEVVGVEALLRLRDEAGNLILPGEFLPDIEDHELIVAVGEWTLDEALRQMAAWAQEGLAITVSVNIAARHLLQPNFVNRLRERLATHPEISPERLELEILETTALADMNAVHELIRRIKAMGVRIALDDFGTGYSSLSYFRRLPTDMLKIDQSFIRDMLDNPEDLSIVEGVVGLTHAFRRAAIAEGVETPQHGVMLLHLGCELGQGFGIARPMPAAEVPGWVADFKPHPAWAASLAFQWRREDFPLFASEIEHTHWLAQIERLLAGDGHVPPPELDARQCRFGRWYYGKGQARYGNEPGYRQLEPLHDEVHRLARAALEAHAGGDVITAQACLGALREASRKLIDALGEFRAELAMGSYFEQQDAVCH
ncbi:MAG: EAL domain-containing protein [Rhodocyclaceae bacterium]|nr:EAL domain-containing protein [Rhodocyclaceae bacterium]